MMAAVSSKCAIAWLRSTKFDGTFAFAMSSQPAPFCSEKQRSPGTSIRPRTAANPGERSRLFRSAGLPAQTRPTASSRSRRRPAVARRSRHCATRPSHARRYGADAGASPSVCGRLINATCVSNAGGVPPRTLTAATPGMRAARPCRPSITSSTTRPPSDVTRGTKRRNCSASPKPCSAQTRIVRPSSGRPSHTGCAHARGPGSPRRKRHSYSRKPSSNRPARSSASALFQCASTWPASHSTAAWNAISAPSHRPKCSSATPRS